MKNKNTLLVIVLVFVLLLGGAYVLYDRLGQEVTAEQMIVHSTPVPTAGPSPEETLPKTQPEAETETAEHEEPEDILAPDFHVYDKDGNTVHLSDFLECECDYDDAQKREICWGSAPAEVLH